MQGIGGGMQATDMGGPINKAAYVFGTASIAMAEGGFSPVMAAVMAGGMVPPIAIAWPPSSSRTASRRTSASPAR